MLLANIRILFQCELERTNRVNVLKISVTESSDNWGWCRMLSYLIYLKEDIVCEFS